MRIIKKKIDKSGNGAVVVVPESDEDLWHIYNLIQKGDTIRTGTSRKVKTESKTGSVSTERIVFLIKLHILNISYYYGEESTDVGLLVKGKNIEQNKYMQVGQIHTVKIELNYPITIFKSNWDRLHMRVLDEAKDPGLSADIAALVMDEGIANLCIVNNMTTLLKAKIERNIPKKFSGIFHYDKAMKGFYDSILQAIINSINFDAIKAFVIASPGFVANEFHKYLMTMGEKSEYSVLKAHKNSFIIVKSTSGYRGSLNEVLSDPAVLIKLKDTKAVKEIEALDRFYKTLSQDSDRVAYGHKYVIEANNHSAIKELLICDTLFRTKNFAMRKMYVNLVDKVKECGGDVYVFSRSHVSGEKLNELSGIAAVLRFPFNMDYLDEKEDEVERQREEEEKKEKLDEEDDKLSDVGSIVNDEELDRDFNEALEESKEKQDKSHSHKDVDKKEHKKDEERKINESSAKDEDGEDI